jgi:hypothetical protein
MAFDRRERQKLTRRARRRTHVAECILTDCRQVDKKRGRINDLDIVFVRDLISRPCAYCGETGIRISLDRIDNSIGHSKANVVQACERCNYFRRDMPHEAWLVIAKAMRKARVKGLFGRWTGGIHKRSTPVIVPKRHLAPHGTLGGYDRCGPPRCTKCRAAMREWKRARRAEGKSN